MITRVGRRIRPRWLAVTLFTFGVICLILGSLSLIILIVNFYDLPGPSTATLTRIRIGLTAFTFLCGVGFFATLVAVGFYNRLVGEANSTLYPPFTLGGALILVVVSLLALSSFDSLIHGLRPQWRLTMPPLLQLMNSLIIAGFLVTKGWGATIVMARSGVSHRVIITLALSAVSLAIVVTVIAFQWAGEGR